MALEAWLGQDGKCRRLIHEHVNMNIGQIGQCVPIEANVSGA